MAKLLGIKPCPSLKKSFVHAAENACIVRAAKPLSLRFASTGSLHPTSSAWTLFGETRGKINWTVALLQDHYGESDPQDQAHNTAVSLQQPLKYSHRGPP